MDVGTQGIAALLILVLLLSSVTLLLFKYANSPSEQPQAQARPQEEEEEVGLELNCWLHGFPKLNAQICVDPCPLFFLNDMHFIRCRLLGEAGWGATGGLEVVWQAG